MQVLVADSGWIADCGLLLLRLAVGMLIIGHAVQKSFGWLGGDGLAATSAVFDRVGYRPGRAMVLVAATTEIAGSLFLMAGAFTPLAGAVLVGVMAVACSVHWPFGVWASNRGFELPLTFAIVAAALAMTGAGGWSLDRILGLDYPAWVALVSLLASFLGAMGLVGLRTLRLKSEAERANASVAR